jgi:hypothetical protein
MLMACSDEDCVLMTQVETVVVFASSVDVVVLRKVRGRSMGGWGEWARMVDVACAAALANESRMGVIQTF